MNTFPLCTGCLTSAAATAEEKTAFDIPRTGDVVQSWTGDAETNPTAESNGCRD